MFYVICLNFNGVWFSAWGLMYIIALCGCSGIISCRLTVNKTGLVRPLQLNEFIMNACYTSFRMTNVKLNLSSVASSCVHTSFLGTDVTLHFTVGQHAFVTMELISSILTSCTGIITMETTSSFPRSLYISTWCFCCLLRSNLFARWSIAGQFYRSK